MCCHMDGPPPAWINALIGRIFWDFLREKYWADMVSHKIQKKLSKIRVSRLTYSRVNLPFWVKLKAHMGSGAVASDFTS